MDRGETLIKVYMSEYLLGEYQYKLVVDGNPIKSWYSDIEVVYTESPYREGYQSVVFFYSLIFSANIFLNLSSFGLMIILQ